MNVAARMAARAEREQRRRITIQSAIAAGAVVVGGMAAWAINTGDPFNSIPDRRINGIDAPAVVDAQGNDVAADCVDFAEFHSRQDISTLPHDRLMEYAAACSLPVGGSEDTVQLIANRMVAFAADPTHSEAGVTRGTAAPQLP